MKVPSKSKVHPGVYVKEVVIPRGLTITESAKKLGIGRPALSNFLNGKAALSLEMAMRLERCFGADKALLLDMQKQYEDSQHSTPEVSASVQRYVPHFLTIKASQIESWAESSLEARSLLAVLIRKLIHSSGVKLKEISFPGYDNAERKGWDGRLDASDGSPWIPEGMSGWEFGVGSNPQTKAEKDYAARISSVVASDRRQTTFVFVTPRNWTGKEKWIDAKRALGDWKDVRAIDANDLEQWLEQSISAQAWLSEKIGMPCEGISTLERCWDTWASASTPRMVPEIFEPSVTIFREHIQSWLEKEPQKPLVVAADSKEEAHAFLACLFDALDVVGTQYKDSAILFESDGLLKKLEGASAPFIPIVCSDALERGLACHFKKRHCITIRPRNMVTSKPDVELELHSHSSFEKALAAMGIEGERAKRLARDSGRSPTILRRRLSEIDAIRTPVWAENSRVARNLIPLVLVGAWHADSKADKEVLSVLGDTTYKEIEVRIAELLTFDDCPVWSIGQYRGVTSKLDGLFAVSRFITKQQLEDFLLLAELVLSEVDPALDLPEHQQWAAGIHGRVRNHSTALRTGFCESLVLLSVHGNVLFKSRLGLNLEAQVSEIVSSLLTPFSLETLQSHENDLPRYAEAAPEVFLRLVEKDLDSAEPVILELMKPAKGGLLGWRCPRTGLLWALERLAWNPEWIARVSMILARLSEIEIEDNWANTPENSLRAIFRWWMPQTSASLEQRIKVVELLRKKFPRIAWRLLIDQFDPHSSMGHNSSRPDWRNDASGSGEPALTVENRGFISRSMEIALDWPSHDSRTLGDLLVRCGWFSKEQKDRVWTLVENWIDSLTDEEEKLPLREKVRRIAFGRQSQTNGLDDAMKIRARQVIAKLTPSDPVLKHRWLFVSEWLTDTFDENDDDEPIDHRKLFERVDLLRCDAIREIWSERGFDGVDDLLLSVDAPAVIGRYMAKCVSKDEQSGVLLHLSSGSKRHRKFEICLRGFLEELEVNVRNDLILDSRRQLSRKDFSKLLQCAPFGGETWSILHGESSKMQTKYWSEVLPVWRHQSEAEITELIDRLIEVNRPRAAFSVIGMLDWDRVETSRLKRLLFEVATNFSEPSDSYRIDGYEVSAALRSLDGRSGITVGEMADLEFRFLEALDRQEYDLPNLQRQLAESAKFFVQVAALTLKRDDEGEDPPELRIDDIEKAKSIAKACFHLLQSFSRIPGTQEDGSIDGQFLKTWLLEARSLFALLARKDVGDQLIGQLLSKSRQVYDNSENSWPCVEICEALEEIASENVKTGFEIGVANARGVFEMRGDGKEEKELASRYRNWGHQIQFDFPFVARILEGIAKSYEWEADWHISEWQVRNRLLD